VTGVLRAAAIHILL